MILLLFAGFDGAASASGIGNASGGCSVGGSVRFRVAAAVGAVVVVHRIALRRLARRYRRLIPIKFNFNQLLHSFQQITISN